jgi:AmmeMemoRadiSam system protein B
MLPEAPRLRPLDVIPIAGDGAVAAVLRDRTDPSSPPLAVSRLGLFLLSLFDGQRNAAGLQAAFALRTGLPLSVAQVEGFIQQLDQACLLEGGRAAQKLARLREEFLHAPERVAIHAGGAYPDDPEELLQFLERCYHEPDGPGVLPDETRNGRLAGLIAPHVDLHRGGPTYAWAARALKQSTPADLYVVLGTCHTPMDTPYAAIRRPYATPLGTAPLAREALAWLEERCTWDLYVDEFSHRAEHSIEFQALYLRYGVGEVPVLPLLCGSLHNQGEDGAAPRHVPEVTQMVDALRELASGPFGSVCFVAGADLAHVGPQFGDAEHVTPAFLDRVARGDLEMLEHVAAGDADGFYRQVMRDQDARRICGLAPIYTLLAVLDGRPGEVLKYTQWADPSGTGSVTFASVVFPD